MSVYDSKKFKGTFDGNNYEVHNVKTNDPSKSYQSFFGIVGDSAVIRDLGLINPNIVGDRGVSVLVAYQNGDDIVTIENCYVEGGTVSGIAMVGGLVGELSIAGSTGSESTININNSYCNNLNMVGRNEQTRYLDYGGLVASGEGTINISNSYFSGGAITIGAYAYSGSYERNIVAIGGLVGTGREGHITNSYFSSTSTSYTNPSEIMGKIIGGIVGEGEISIENCYSDLSSLSIEGDVDKIYLGGIIGSWADNDSIKNSYWLYDASKGLGVERLVGYRDNSDFSNNVSYFNTELQLHNTVTVNGIVENKLNEALNGWVIDNYNNKDYNGWVESAVNGYPSFATTTFLSVDSTAILVDPGDSFTLTAILKDSSNNLLSDKDIVFYQVIDDSTIELGKMKSNSNGEASLTIDTANPPVGFDPSIEDTTFIVEFEGNSSYASSKDNIQITINPKNKIDPKDVANDIFEFTPPTNLFFDGNAKTATVTGKSSGEMVAPTGNIIVKYYSEDGTEVVSPTEIGKYIVKIDYESSSESDNYSSSTDITSDSWNFTITKKHDWGNVSAIENIVHYVDQDGKTSVEVDGNNIIWLKDESAGTSSWYGLDNTKGVFEEGSRFYVQGISKQDNIDEWNTYFDKIDENKNIKINEEKTWIFLIGVVSPSGEEYVEFDVELPVYVQLREDLSKDDLHSVYISDNTDEVVPNKSVQDFTYPEGSSDFVELSLTHFSPYAVFEATYVEDPVTENNDAVDTSDSTNTTIFITSSILSLLGFVIFIRNKRLD